MERRANERMMGDAEAMDEEEDEEAGPGNQIILHEDKKYYPGAQRQPM